EERRLLPAPYQTNCTDYMTSWRNRGGIGPLNPIMVVEECIYNLSLEAFGCIPFSVDYPHNDSICNDCEDCFNMTHIANDCSKLLNKYNQPCECQMIHVEISFKDFEITTTTYEPKLEHVAQCCCDKITKITSARVVATYPSELGSSIAIDKDLL
ncbi:uncharacterized protein NPIL_98081, partial [Nephila pilipes]